MQWFGAAHGQIIDGAIDRQAADVAARKKNRRDGKRIRGKCGLRPGRKKLLTRKSLSFVKRPRTVHNA